PMLVAPPRVAGTTTWGSRAGVSTAMSVCLSADVTAAAATVPSAYVTVMPPPLATTWAAVRMVPLSDTMTPAPRSFPSLTVTTDGESRWKISGTLMVPVGLGAGDADEE